MATPKYEWYAEEVSGTTADLTVRLNALEADSYEIFDVNGLLLVNAHGWVIIARKELPKQEQKIGPPPKAEDPQPPRRGTVLLHKGHKK